MSHRSGPSLAPSGVRQRQSEARAAAQEWADGRISRFDAGPHWAGIACLALIGGVATAATGQPWWALVAGAVASPWALYVVVRAAVEAVNGPRLDGIGAELRAMREEVRERDQRTVSPGEDSP